MMMSAMGLPVVQGGGGGTGGVGRRADFDVEVGVTHGRKT
jgi:hypothetical protein